ncbi:MAG: hypothetical protein JWQ38_3097 [Flavipsychrobacter sp.]|nr:hypothetical protein [Flavipsychrobacter sp.]
MYGHVLCIYAYLTGVNGLLFKNGGDFFVGKAV